MNLASLLASLMIRMPDRYFTLLTMNLNDNFKFSSSHCWWSTRSIYFIANKIKNIRHASKTKRTLKLLLYKKRAISVNFWTQNNTFTLYGIVYIRSVWINRNTWSWCDWFTKQENLQKYKQHFIIYSHVWSIISINIISCTKSQQISIFHRCWNWYWTCTSGICITKSVS